MIIETRYRDIEFDEIECCRGQNDSRINGLRKFWPTNRGKKIFVEIPASNHPIWGGCKEPTYTRVNPDGSRYIGNFNLPVAVCPHSAEIGD